MIHGKIPVDITAPAVIPEVTQQRVVMCKLICYISILYMILSCLLIDGAIGHVSFPLVCICPFLRAPRNVHCSIIQKRSFILFISHRFTLDNNFLRWTYFGPTKFIQSWTTLVHATLRVSDVTYKCKCWLADVTFDWRHVMVTAVERNNQTRRIITFLRRLFARLKSKFHK